MRAVFEQVISFGTDLFLLEASAGTENVGADVVYSCLKLGSGGFSDSLHVIVGDSTGTEDSSVGEPLGGEVTDGEFR